MLIQSNEDTGRLQLFTNRKVYGVTASSNNSALLNNVLRVVSENKFSYSIEFLKAIYSIFDSKKYFQSKEGVVFLGIVAPRATNFSSQYAQPVNKLWRGEKLSSQEISAISGLPVAAKSTELITQLFREIVINESLAVGLILTEDEINFEESGDGSEEEEPTDPTVVQEDFHFAQAALYYAGVEASSSGYATLKGYGSCLGDLCRLVDRSAYKMSFSGWKVSGFASYGSVTNWAAGATGKLLGWKLLSRITPGLDSVSTYSSKDMTFKCSFGLKKVRKILLEFSGSPMSSFIGMNHLSHAAGYGGFLLRKTLSNPFQYRWLADNLMEIEVDHGYQSEVTLDVPSAMLSTAIPATNNPGSVVISSLVAGRTCATLNPTGPTTNLLPIEAGMSKSLQSVTYGIPTVGVSYPLQVKTDVYPIEFDEIPFKYTIGSVGILGCRGPMINSGSLSSEISSMKSTSADAAFEIHFSTPSTLVSVVCLEAMLGSYQSLS